jgi:uncharacterized LabA/DUF88 family protein
MVFIDGNNFEKAVCSLYGHNKLFHYEKLARYIAEKKCNGILQRFYYYTAQSDRHLDPDKFDKTQGFINRMRSEYSRCIIRVGKLEPRGTTKEGKIIFVEKQTDVNIATDMLSLAYTDGYDIAVLLSTDTDYRPAIELIRNLGKIVIAGIVDEQPGRTMKSLVDEHFYLKKEDLEQCLR